MEAFWRDLWTFQNALSFGCMCICTIFLRGGVAAFIRVFKNNPDGVNLFDMRKLGFLSGKMSATRPRYLLALSLYTIYLKNLRLSVKHGKHMGLLISFWNPTDKGDKRTKEVWTNKDKENASIDHSR